MEKLVQAVLEWTEGNGPEWDLQAFLSDQLSGEKSPTLPSVSQLGDVSQ